MKSTRAGEQSVRKDRVVPGKKTSPTHACRMDEAPRRVRRDFQLLVLTIVTTSVVPFISLAGGLTPRELTPYEKALVDEASRQPVRTKFTGISGSSTLNISIPTNSGLGDVASNLQMAELLQKKFPGIQINFLFQQGETTRNKLATLIPGFDKNLSIQKVGSTLFWLIDVASLPRADAVLSFSRTSGKFSIPTRAAISAPLRVSFSEFGDFDFHRAKGTGSPVDTSHARMSPYRDMAYFGLNTGAQEGGFYISREIPPKRHSAGSLVKSVRDLAGVESVGEAIAIDDTVEIGFSYTSRPEPSTDYVHALSRKARENPGRKFVAIVNASKPSDLPALSANLEVIYVKSLPYELSKECVANATLPIMITGDGSLNLALEYGKPFMYETHYWKQESARALRQTLGSSEAFKANKRSYEIMKSVIPGTAVSYADPFSPRVDAIYAALNDSRFQDDFRRALSEVRGEQILTEKIEKVFEFLANKPQVEASEFSHFVRTQLNPPTGTRLQGAKDLFKPVGSRKIGHRLMRDWRAALETPRSGLSALFEQGDFSTIHAVVDAVLMEQAIPAADIYRRVDFFETLAASLRKSKHTEEVKKLIQFLISNQDPVILEALARNAFSGPSAIHYKDEIRLLIKMNIPKVSTLLIDNAFEKRRFEKIAYPLDDLLVEMIEGPLNSDLRRIMKDQVLDLRRKLASDPNHKLIESLWEAIDFEAAEDRSRLIRKLAPEFFPPKSCIRSQLEGLIRIAPVAH